MNVACITSHAPRLPYLRAALEAVCVQAWIERVLLLVVDELLTAASEQAHGLPVQTHPVPEIGPGKKHLGSQFCEPEDVIVTFDDDFCYAADHATGLLRAVRTVDAVCGYCGYDLAGTTVLEGTAVYLNGATAWAYRAGWLRAEDVLAWGRLSECWHSDDIYMGRVFQDAGRRVVVVPGEKHHVYPPPNIGAWFVQESLMYHPDRTSRSRACIQAAFHAGQEGTSA